MYFPNQNEPFYYTLRFLQYSSYYPWPNQAEKWYNSTSILVRVFTSFVSIECALHCTMALKDGIPVGISEDIVGLTGVANCMFVSAMFQLQAKRWSSCVLDIIDTKKFGLPPKMPQMVKKTERIAIWYSIYCTVGILTYTFYSAIKATSCHEQNLKKGTHEICGMITPFWWPYKDINPIVKLLFNLYQLVSVLLILPPSALVTFASWAASQIIKTKIHHLKGLFADVFSDKDSKRQKARLKCCIQYHQHIFK
ncbi:hypothetical protein HUJ04_008395 [Dendroctonus ponderosae]|nr:hypothetical protein HUJ04_008395 [Dendroctonus ponderosae]